MASSLAIFPTDVFGVLGGSRVRLGIGGVSVQVAASRTEDVTLDSEHQAFRIENGDSDIAIDVQWVPYLSPSLTGVLFDSCTTWRLHQHQRGFQFDFGDPITSGQACKRLIVDHEFRRAEIQMSAGYFSMFPQQADPLGYPLDELLITHRLTQEKAIELHGCGIVTVDGTGNLFIGHSGAGKSTTTRLWTAAEDVEILSDDRIIVREHPGQMRMYGTPWHGEAMFASPASAPLTRIMILEHGHGNVLTRLSPSEAVAELFARSFVPMHRHEYVESALEFLESVAESIPCYRYSFEPDPRAVEKILSLRD